MWKKLTNINKILVPVDLSDDSTCAVEAALTFSMEKKPQIYLMHVMQKHTGGQSATQGTSENRDNPESDFQSMALEDFFMNKIRNQSRFAYIVRSGIPHEEILTFTREEGVDLLIMPIGRKGGAGTLAPGGITCQVIENAGIPVLIIPADTPPKKNPWPRHFHGSGDPRDMAHEERPDGAHGDHAVRDGRSDG